MDPELIRRLPKTDLHVHLDGSLRLSHADRAGARARRSPLPSETEDGLRETGVPSRTTATSASTWRASATRWRCCRTPRRWSARPSSCARTARHEGVRYLEIRFAPQLHVRAGFEMTDVVRAVDRGLRRAADAVQRAARGRVGRRSRRFVAGMILCALRFFTPEFSPGYRRFFEALPEAPRAGGLRRGQPGGRARRRAPRHEEGLLVVGVDLAGQEKGYPAEDHRVGLPGRARGVPRQDRARRRGLRPGVDLPGHRRLHADRIGHGTWLFDETQDPRPAHHGPPGVRGAARAVHRRQAHHDRGLPDLEPADRARAGRRPAPPPVRRDAQAPALHDVLHGQPPGLATRR